MNNLPQSEENVNEEPALTEHELKVKWYMLRLSGLVAGFPTNDKILDRHARLWAEFASTEVYHVKPNRDELRWLDAAQITKRMEPYMWKDGLIPMEWLVKEVARSCEFFPAPIKARELYCKAGFTPLDKRHSDDMPWIARRLDPTTDSGGKDE